jgi:hypothetical protein
MLKLGRKPHDPARLARLPKAAPHLVGISNVPPVVDWSMDVAPNAWGVYDNDTIGDCTAAGVAHLTIGWESYHPPMLLPTTAEVVAIYENFGYDPKQTQPDGENPTDQGAVCVDVLNLWYSAGYVLGGKRNVLMAHCIVTPKNHDEVRAGLYAFGALYIGVQLREAQMTEPVWQTTTGPIAGGHCVTVHRIDQNGGLVCSWGKLYQFTWDWWDACVDEVHAPLNSKWLAVGKAPQGLAVSDLESEMTYLEQAA